ncbi:12642_t:CDS:2 [Acaulospora morrowiae]|uniref:12642_t:CDS:1 n=1 Tax=Acaulospora morrowiae TaxID=94023 RepID=A0A9N8VSU7_9GLOM|nr:12642_t:CDS:2 [Acaulospora morrowiae]
MSSLKDSFKIAIDYGFIKSFDYKAFENCKPIARGAFGTVHKAYFRNIEKNVALKSLHYDETDDEHFYNDFIRELQNISAVNYSDNVVKFLGISLDHLTDTHYLVLEYAEDGDLRSYLPSSSHFDLSKKKNLFEQHSKNILVHRGRLLIADLGLSKPLDKNLNSSYSVAGGTFAYSDPQYLKNPEHYKRHKASDIYSVGVLLWELSSGKTPFNNKPLMETLTMISNGVRETPVNGTPLAYIQIYTKAWVDDPEKRPTIGEIQLDLRNIQMEPVHYDNSAGPILEATNETIIDSGDLVTFRPEDYNSGSLNTVGPLSNSIWSTGFDSIMHEKNTSEDNAGRRDVLANTISNPTQVNSHGSYHQIKIPNGYTQVNSHGSYNRVSLSSGYNPLSGSTQVNLLDSPTQINPTQVNPLSVPTQVNPLSISAQMKSLSIPTQVKSLSIPTQVKSLSIPTQVNPLNIPTQVNPLNIPTQVNPLSGPTQANPLRILTQANLTSGNVLVNAHAQSNVNVHRDQTKSDASTSSPVKGETLNNSSNNLILPPDNSPISKSDENKDDRNQNYYHSCEETLKKIEELHYSNRDFEDSIRRGSSVCDAHLHVALGDIQGLKWHLDNGSSAVDYYGSFMEKIMLYNFALKYCNAEKIMLVLETLKPYHSGYPFYPKMEYLLNNSYFKNTRGLIESKKIMRWFVDEGYDINSKNVNSMYTLYDTLHQAVDRNLYYEIIYIYLENKFDPNNPYNASIPNLLFFGIQEKYSKVTLELILDFGVNKKTKNDKGMNALAFATKLKNMDAMECLLENGLEFSESQSLKDAIKYCDIWGKEKTYLKSWQGKEGESKRLRAENSHFLKQLRSLKK